MANLFRFIRVFEFQEGLDRIRTAYAASMASMIEAEQKAGLALDAYEASGEDDSEYDDEGVLTHSTRAELRYGVLNASQALPVVREAFVTSAFHWWEQEARSWTGLHDAKSNFLALCQAVSALGWTIDGLARINTLNNLLKHRNPKLAVKLANLHPNYFSRLPDDAGKGWWLSISDEHVQEAFDIVLTSGPKKDAAGTNWEA